MIQAKASDQCEVKVLGKQCPNKAIALVFDNLLCCELHRLNVYSAWAERASGEVILH